MSLNVQCTEGLYGGSSKFIVWKYVCHHLSAFSRTTKRVDSIDWSNFRAESWFNSVNYVYTLTILYIHYVVGGQYSRCSTYTADWWCQSVIWTVIDHLVKHFFGNNLDKLRHPRSVAYSAEQVLLNKQQILCGGAYPDCYPFFPLSARHWIYWYACRSYIIHLKTFQQLCIEC